MLFCEKNLKEALEKETDDARTAALKSNLEYVLQQKGLVHGDNATTIAQSMLRVLGFDETGEKAPLSSLSGGLRMRVALACAFFIDPDVLLLDGTFSFDFSSSLFALFDGALSNPFLEPTNHLDLPSVLWLENRLRAYKGSFLLVTHDRTLLENVVTSVMLIQDLKLENYATTFKEFEIQKVRRRTLSPTSSLRPLQLQLHPQPQPQRRPRFTSFFVSLSNPSLGEER